MDVQTDLRIIVIDDNPAIHQDFIKILKTNKPESKLETLSGKLFGQKQEAPQMVLPIFTIDTATQGQEGVQRIQQALTEGRPYAVAFVDIRMPPGWDGVETIKNIWKLDTDIQVVICTAYSDYSWEETIAELGVSDNLLILKKPFDSVAVRQLACALTKKWQLMQDSRKHTDFLEQTVQERTYSLQQSLSVTRATMESSYDGILVVDNKNNVMDYNKRFIEIWGLPEAVCNSKDYTLFEKQMIFNLKNPEDYKETIERLTLSPNEVILNTLKFNDERVIEFYSLPQKIDEVTIGRVWSFRDISQRVNLEKMLEHQATHDSLTDLPNRHLLMDKMKQEIVTAKQNNTLFAVIFFDIDRFKLVNDSLGHEVGDTVLSTIATRLRVGIRREDSIARLGGDEFVLISPALKKAEHAINVASKILEIVKEPIKTTDRNLTMTTSIGISVYPVNGTTADELLRNADLAMYRAKSLGRNQWQFYTDDLNQQSKQHLDAEIELRHALVANEFFIEYQPQFDSKKQNKLVAVEALIRWKHPLRGLLLPLDFIPLAEETGLIVSLGEWALRTVCQQNKLWQDQGLPPIRVTINIALQQFKEPNFVKLVASILQETGLKPEYLEMEVTESTVVEHVEVISCISELKKMGIQIVLDDFGTGSRGLNYLKKIPIDRLKIDRSFIRNIDSVHSDEVVIQAIILMANSLNLEVVGDGVETQQQVDFLKARACSEFQGYFFSKPLSAQDLEALLKKSS